MKTIIVSRHRQIPDNYTGIVEWDYGSKVWLKDGNLHRLDGPAKEHISGVKDWYINNKLHRLDGPAVEYPDGDKYWWVDGVQVTEAEYPQEVLFYKCKMVLY